MRPSNKHINTLKKLPLKLQSLSEYSNNIKGFYGQNNPGGFMSNFYQCEINVPSEVFNIPELEKTFGKTIKFNNSEQLFMFWKGVVFYNRNKKENLKILINIVKSTNPQKAKSLGRQLYCQALDDSKPFDDDTWKEERCQCMYDACYYKFTQNPDLKKWLKETGDKHLVEATSRDKIWGCGVNVDDPRLNYPAQWNGLNLLGEVLMVLRDEL